jgi:hypothetical protein
MATLRRFKIITWSLSIALLLTTAALGYLLFQNFIWKLEATRYAESDGRVAAHSLFRKGGLSLFTIEGACDEDRFSGRREGPFEIWIKFYQPSLGSAHRHTAERWVESFNDQMRRMQKEPEKFRRRLGSDEK